MSYSLHEWLLFFFIYCFLGWVWESTYDSIRKHKWDNRGFMHGPCLPIYGSGAIVILVSTMAVTKYPVLVYFCGLLGATLLEVVTGELMLRIFHVRYWDYSGCFLNFRGHICFKSSVLWGFFSLGLVYGLHVPIEKLVLKIPSQVVDIGTTVILVAAVVDFTVSFREALDFKEILDKLTENNKELKFIRDHIEEAKAHLEETGEHIEEAKKHLEHKKEMLEHKMSDYMKGVRGILKRNPVATLPKYEEALKQLKERLHNGPKEYKE